MFFNRRVVALVPIKEHSERVSAKNFRSFGGKPLYHHILDTLERTYAIDTIVINTDSPAVMQEAPRIWKKAKVVERPESLRGDHMSVNKLIEYDLEQEPGDIYVQTHATNPLLRAETVARALRAYIDQESQYDSLFGVTRYQSRFYDRDQQPINHNPNELIRTQDLPALFEENSTLYIFTKASFEKRGRRIGETPMFFETPPLESIDIDEEFTFRLAELLCMYSGSDRQQ